jgi:hypothetical protein
MRVEEPRAKRPHDGIREMKAEWLNYSTSHMQADSSSKGDNMCWTNVLASRAAMLFGLVGIMIFCASTMARDEIGLGSRDDPKASNLNGERQGWLIMGGKLIPGPYVVRIVEGLIEINEKKIEKPVRPAVSIAVNPSVAAKHQVLETLRTALRTWTVEEGFAAARERALAFMQSQPLVESVRFDSDNHLRVVFHDEKYAEYVDLVTRNETQVSREEVRAQYIESQAKALEYWLTHGSLVILQNGMLMATSPGEGEATLRHLQEIVSSTADMDTRAALISKIIPDSGMAKAISEQLSEN